MVLFDWRTLARSGRCFLVAGMLVGNAFAQEPAEPDPFGVSPSTAPHVMEQLRVTGSRVTEIDLAGPDAIQTHDAEHIRDTGSFDVEEFLEQLRPPDAGTEQLILIDGKPAYIDPTSLPPGMIESIEISDDGAMPQYGAYASGRIINIRLKKNQQGQELGAKRRDTFAGGGDQLTTRLAGGVSKGKWRVIYTLDQRRRDPLFASQRDFSRDQNHTARGGRDLRLTWGYPPVIQSSTGPLIGVVNAQGDPSSVALVPPDQDGSNLTPGEFIPGSPGGAENQRRFNTAAYRLLMNPSKRLRANLGVDYTFSDRLSLSISGSLRETRGERISAPPVSEPSVRTQVPAAFNPFNQDVQVGMVHTEFGPTRQSTHATRSQLGFQLSGRLAETWKWDASLGFRGDNSREIARDLDPEKFATALASPDLARRFNPFGDARFAPLNAHLYPELVDERIRDYERQVREVELSLSGPVAETPGGDVTLALETELEDLISERVRFRSGEESTRVSRFHTRSAEFSASSRIPFIGQQNARRFAQRLDAQLSAEYGADTEDGSGTEYRADTIWVPASFLLIRGRYSSDFDTPSRRTAVENEALVGETVIDPRRGSTPTSDVQVVVRDVVVPAEEKTERVSLDATLEPTFLPGLEFSVSYKMRRRVNLYEDDFEAQDIVNNEAAFQERVTRAAALPEDITVGRPGPITMVDVTPGNAGRRYNRKLEFEFAYRVPSETFGRFRVTASAERTLESRNEILPGVILVDEAGIPRRNPDWEFEGMVAWSNKGWRASVSSEYTGEVPGLVSGTGVSSHATIDVNLGHTFGAPLFGRFGKGATVALGLDNVFDEPPPYTDTLSGYRDGSPLGRSVSMAVTLPF